METGDKGWSPALIKEKRGGVLKKIEYRNTLKNYLEYISGGKNTRKRSFCSGSVFGWFKKK